MIDFMVIAAPRSGTAWASVWLTGRYSVCYHDPLWDRHVLDIDAMSDKHPHELCGISCTGIANFPDLVNRHPARKVILHRNRDEVAASAKRAFDWPAPSEYFFSNLGRIEGMHVPWTDLWENPEPIYEHLLQQKFDVDRHARLRHLRIETKRRQMSPELRRRYALDGVMIRD